MIVLTLGDNQDPDEDGWFLRYLERELNFSEARVAKLEKEVKALGCRAEGYRMDWILSHRRVVFAEREIAEDSTYWVDAFSCGQPGPRTASPPSCFR